MTLFQALALGTVQGAGEFLPISSSAHLIALPWAMRWDDPGLAFDVALHLGTLVALVVYFRADLWRLARALVLSVVERRIGDDRERRLAWLVAVGSLPGAAIGYALEHAAEEKFRDNLAAIAATMIAMGILLWLVDAFVSAKRPIADLGWRDALLIGLAQAAAIVPGVSRSGSTITVGRALGLDREASARFSFLLAAPIILGAGLLKVPKLVKAGGLDAMVLISTLAAAIVGYAAIGILLRFLRTRSYLPFAVYRVAFGVATIALWYARR